MAHMNLSLGVPALVITLLLGACGEVPAPIEDPDFVYERTDVADRFVETFPGWEGSRISSVGDLDGDGVDDLFIEVSTESDESGGFAVAFPSPSGVLQRLSAVELDETRSVAADAPGVFHHQLRRGAVWSQHLSPELELSAVVRRPIRGGSDSFGEVERMYDATTGPTETLDEFSFLAAAPAAEGIGYELCWLRPSEDGAATERTAVSWAPGLKPRERHDVYELAMLRPEGAAGGACLVRVLTPAQDRFAEDFWAGDPWEASIDMLRFNSAGVVVERFVLAEDWRDLFPVSLRDELGALSTLRLSTLPAQSSSESNHLIVYLGSSESVFTMAHADRLTPYWYEDWVRWELPAADLESIVGPYRFDLALKGWAPLTSQNPRHFSILDDVVLLRCPPKHEASFLMARSYFVYSGGEQDAPGIELIAVRPRPEPANR